MEMGNFYGQMALDIQGNGRMAFNKEWEYKFYKKVAYN